VLIHVPTSDCISFTIFSALEELVIRTLIRFGHVGDFLIGQC
jgi:hypothetical protein